MKLARRMIICVARAHVRLGRRRMCVRCARERDACQCNVVSGCVLITCVCRLMLRFGKGCRICSCSKRQWNANSRTEITITITNQSRSVTSCAARLVLREHAVQPLLGCAQERTHAQVRTSAPKLETNQGQRNKQNTGQIRSYTNDNRNTKYTKAKAPLTLS